MKIAAVDLYEVHVPDRPWAWSDEENGMPAHRQDGNLLIVVRCDEGVDGLGELTLRGGRQGRGRRCGRRLDRARAPQAVPAARRGPRGRGVRVRRPRHPRQGAGMPVSELLGGAVRDRVPVTLCTGYKTVENTAADAVWGWERGFRTYKMKCITGTPHLCERIDYVVDRVEAIHRELPDMDVRPDIRRRLEEVWAAEEVARRLEGHRLDCLESPIITGAHGDSFSEWRRLRQRIGCPVAEHTGAERLLTMWSAEALDYAIIGAPSALGTVRLSAMAEQLGLPCWTQYVGLGINNALGLQVCAAGPSLSRPHDFVGFWAKQDDCVQEEFPVVEGAVKVPDAPGLGVTLDMDAVGRYAAP